MRRRRLRPPLREPAIHAISPPKAATRVGKADCAHCAAVCCRLIVVVEDADGVDPALTAVTDTGLRVMARAPDGWCVALDRERMQCGIYARRPDACRRFHMGGPYCRAVREDFARGHAGPVPFPTGGSP